MSKTQAAGHLLPPLREDFKYFPYLTRRRCGILIFVLGIVFYSTSFKNEYALDDGIIIHQNDHVLKGVRGIKDILTRDAYESFYRRMCATDQLAGGRYRPLSVVSFALEQELIGTYRSGLYTRVEDANKNGVLDQNMVNYISSCGRPEKNYEINAYTDSNNDGIVQGNECLMCWDKNENFKEDIEEDLNQDGLLNEVDCQLYGAEFRHFNNIWLYALGCFLLYRLFAFYFFRGNQDLAFLAALLFTIHPIHSEAVANVKSRDEIFSLIFVALTFIYAFRYIETKRTKDLFITAFVFLLALLSKEYAVMLLALVPIAMYCFTNHRVNLLKPEAAPEFKTLLYTSVAFVICVLIMTWIKRDFDVHAAPGTKPVRSFWLLPFVYLGAGIYLSGAHRKKGFVPLMSWLFLIMLIYIGMRWMAVKLKPGVPDTEILNNPYLLATGEERFCTKTYVLLKYILLQIFPHPLSSDYSFDSIKFRHFTSPDFVFSLLLHLSMLFAAVYLTWKKHVTGFALMVYILFGLLIGNVLMDIGATMGERLIFHSSIGFCIILAWALLWLSEHLRLISLKTQRFVLPGLLIVVVFLAGVKTWERNFDWKNDITLFLKDVQTHPNSVLCLGNAGARYVDLLNTNDFADHPRPGYDTLFDDHNGTLSNLLEEVKSGKYKNKREAAIGHGIEVLSRAIELHPRYVNGYLNLGLLYFHLRKDFEAIYNLKNVERLYPNNPYLNNYYMAMEGDLRNRVALAYRYNRWDSAAIAWNLLTIIRPGNHENWYHLGGAYFNQGKFELAEKSWKKTQALKPDHPEINGLLNMARARISSRPPIQN